VFKLGFRDKFAGNFINSYKYWQYTIYHSALISHMKQLDARRHTTPKRPPQETYEISKRL